MRYMLRHFFIYICFSKIYKYLQKIKGSNTFSLERCIQTLLVAYEILGFGHFNEAKKTSIATGTVI